MKRKISLLIVSLLLSTVSLMAQTPELFHYQAVLRNAKGKLYNKKNVDVKVEILEDDADGFVVFTETHNVTTSPKGYVNIQVGSIEGGFLALDWGDHTYFIRISVDNTEVGTSQIISVPYALHAKTAESYNETDPVFINSAANTITYSNITDWLTAYGWGNHSTEGYLKNFAETDPAFLNSPVYAVTSGNISNWSAAYSWGDHSQAGYLTEQDQYVETDPIFINTPAFSITSDNLSNWNNAFSWGDHTGLYKDIAYTPTWNEITGTAPNVSSFNNDTGFITGYTESDPAFNAWNKSEGITITESQISDLGNYLIDYTESDPVFINTPAYNITNDNIANWNNAFGRGDHTGLYKDIAYVPAWNEITGTAPNVSTFNNDAGYITYYTESDPFFNAWNKSEGITITESQISDLGTYLTSYTETDPVFINAAAYNITSENITNWSTAFGWGDHTGLYKDIAYVPAWNEITGTAPNVSTFNNDAGYITNFTENDPIYKANFNIVNPQQNQVLQYNNNSGKWENQTTDYLTEENDGSITNELQNLSLSGNYLTISDGNTVKLGENNNDKTLSEILTVNNDAGNNSISNLANPVSGQDAATKDYTDMMLKILKNNGYDITVIDFTFEEQSNHTFNFTSTSTIEPTKWFWNFGDGNTSEIENPVHTYTKSGTYTVSHTASNNVMTVTETKENLITTNVLLDFTYNEQNGEYSFSSSSSFNPTEWFWDFGDGNTSTEEFPVYTYSKEGSYTVRHTASNHLISVTETKENFLNPFELDFSFEENNGEYTFSSSSSFNPTEWLWDFGDGNTGTDQNPTHIYPNSNGSYTVKLTVSDGTNSKTEIKTNYITIVGVTNGCGVSDYDGNSYSSVIIGEQEWIAENLKTTHYADGTTIPYVPDQTAWANLEDNNIDDAYCYYNNNVNSEYGALYTWAAAMKKSNSSNTNPSGRQGICPTGWHLPSAAEWIQLTNFLGGSSIAGGKLKETGLEHWTIINTGATNEAGFTALPGGDRYDNNFVALGVTGNWWVSDELNTTRGKRIVIARNETSISTNSNDTKSLGLSVRCVKDGQTGQSNSAGPDQNITTGALSVTLAANTPSVGTGGWSIVSGEGGSLSDPNSPTSTFTGSACSDYTLCWTIDGNCGVSTDFVSIRFSSGIKADAGSDQNIESEDYTTILSANTPTSSIGTWSIISGEGGSLTDPNSPTSTFIGTACTNYTLCWTIDGNCETSTDYVSIKFSSLNADAGPDQNITSVEHTAILQANTLVSGTGTWSVISGEGGSFSEPNSPTSSFTGTACTTYNLRWKIEGDCGTSTDDVIIKFSFIEPNAGPDQVIQTDEHSTTLAADTPESGTGIWRIISGSAGDFEDPNSPNSIFSGTPCSSYALRWTVNTECGDISDDVMILFNANPIANAGPDQNIMTDEHTVTLAANSPLVGSGIWRIVSGVDGSFSDLYSPTSTFSGTACTSYTLRWSVTTECGTVTDDIEITFNSTPIANAGEDQNIAISESSTVLDANMPVVGVGTWSKVSGDGGSFSDPYSPTSTFTKTACVNYILRWSVETECRILNDDVIIKFDSPIVEAGELKWVDPVKTTITLDAITPSEGTGTWSILNGAGVFSDPNSPISSFSGNSCTNNTLKWTVNSPNCGILSDNVQIIFNAGPTKASITPPYEQYWNQGVKTDPLGGNTPIIGTGTWSIVSGGEGSFSDPNSPSSIFTGTHCDGEYVLKWEISNICGLSNYWTTRLEFHHGLPDVDAGEDKAGLASDNEVTLSANTPCDYCTGEWYHVSGPSDNVYQFSDENSPNSTFSGNGTAGTYILRWQVTTNCGRTWMDDVVVTFTED
ncbi:MAG: PKD domain-containing protein [bacterium]|nr:PKD domain-containing protein [bacterium]